MFRFTIRDLLWLTMVVGMVAFLGFTGHRLFVWSATQKEKFDRDIVSAYAAWKAANMVAFYQDSHDGKWPRPWADLATYSDVQPQTDLSEEEFKDRIEINFSLSSEERESIRLREAASESVWLVRRRDGRPVYFSDGDPDRILRERLKRTKSP